MPPMATPDCSSIPEASASTWSIFVTTATSFAATLTERVGAHGDVVSPS